MRQIMTRAALLSTIAENRVPKRAPIKIALVYLLSLSTMFLICLLNPIKNPVLLLIEIGTQQELIHYQMNI